MAFPASVQVKVDGFQKLRRVATDLKQSLETKRNTMSTQSVTGNFILSILSQTKEAIGVFETVEAIDGIAEYVREQHNDPTIDVVAEFTSMKNAANSVLGWIVSNLPKDNQDYLLLKTIDVDGNITFRQFTPAQTANLRTQIDGLLATIG